MAVPESVMPITRENSKKTSEKTGKRVFFVTQELKFARALAGNDKSLRRSALKNIKKWIPDRLKCLDFTEDDFLRIWKGLFYCMWMSDKPLVQEECAESIANLIHTMPEDPALLFFKCGLQTLLNEWFGLDHFRLAKFSLFVRRLLRQSLVFLNKSKWSREKIEKFTAILSETVLNPKEVKSVGLVMHFTEIYLEEVAKVTEGRLNPYFCVQLVVPFIKMLVLATDPRIISHIRKFIFSYLIKQSNLGMDYEEKYQAWKQQGFPGSINSMKKIEVASTDETVENDEIEETVENDEAEEVAEKPLDPRAGRVDVEIPQLKFDAKAMIAALTAHHFEKGSNSKGRKAVADITEQFKKLRSGIYPLGVTKIKFSKSEVDSNVRRAVNRLVKFDKQITGKQTKRKRKSKNIPDVVDKKAKLNLTTEKTNDENIEKPVELLRKRKVANSIDTWSIEKPVEKILRKRKVANSIDTWSIEKPVEKILRKRKVADLADMPVEAPKKVKLRPVVESIGVDPVEARKRVKITPVVESIGADKPIESIFRRNSGTWFVTRNDKLNNTNSDSEWKKNTIPVVVLKNCSPKKKAEICEATPTKKVVINTSLNMEQDVRQHHAQILSSPAIPFDANKKPAKPLLKTPTIRGPVNPFYDLR